MHVFQCVRGFASGGKLSLGGGTQGSHPSVSNPVGQSLLIMGRASSIFQLVASLESTFKDYNNLSIMKAFWTVRESYV